MTAHQPMTAGDAGLLQRLALYLLDASADRIEQDMAGILLAEELGAEILGTSKLSGVALIGAVRDGCRCAGPRVWRCIWTDAGVCGL